MIKQVQAGEVMALTTYAYSFHRPSTLLDPDGRQPVKKQAGTAAGVRRELEASTEIGLAAGAEAMTRLLNLGETELSLGRGPAPVRTAFLGRMTNRYVYTRRGGWIDMNHFMFYAARAARYRQDGADTTAAIKKTLKDGEWQEWADENVAGAPHSAYSYEDLPSDRFGAEFAAGFFCPYSGESLAAQIEKFLNSLGATVPEQAPNWAAVPVDNDAAKRTPFTKNETVEPTFTTPDKEKKE